jgi:hypothetical protein
MSACRTFALGLADPQEDPVKVPGDFRTTTRFGLHEDKSVVFHQGISRLVVEGPIGRKSLLGNIRQGIGYSH